MIFGCHVLSVLIIHIKLNKYTGKCIKSQFDDYFLLELLRNSLINWGLSRRRRRGKNE